MAYMKLDPIEVAGFLTKEASKWKNYARDTRMKGDLVVMDYNLNGEFQVYRMTEHQATHHDGSTMLYFGNDLTKAIDHFNQGA